MNLDFDLAQVATTEFGIGRDGDAPPFSFVVVDAGVQNALIEMCLLTWSVMQDLTDNPPKYEPSEKYASSEYVFVALADDLATRLRQLHTANNLPTDNTVLTDPSTIFCYFVRLTDQQGRRLTALRRAAQFKGVLKTRLVRFASDALRLVEDRVFKLDVDFDLLVDNQNLHILRPLAFEFVGDLQEAVLAAVSQNIAALKQEMTFLNFDVIERYAAEHPRAARYLASIRSQQNTENIDRLALKRLCGNTGVEIRESKGKIVIDEGAVLGFLEVLDRRRYKLELIKGTAERFKATSRSQLQN